MADCTIIPQKPCKPRACADTWFQEGEWEPSPVKRARWRERYKYVPKRIAPRAQHVAPALTAKQKRLPSFSLKSNRFKLAEPTGFEPATSDVTGRRSNQLNYDSAFKPELSKAGHSRLTLDDR